MEELEVLGLGAAVVAVIYIFLKIYLGDDKKLTQGSYHRYSKFLDKNYVTFMDEHFVDKLYNIQCLVTNGEQDLKKIAKETNCTLEECILKIKYLQTKHQLTQYHIDAKWNKIVKCTPEELQLIKKYTPFIHNHFTIDEITTKKRRSMTQHYDLLRENIYKDLKYLVDNDLVSGIRLNEVDKEIIYYSLEKKKTKDLITITCPNCGALNDVHRGEKVRCEYCSTILESDKQNSKN